MPGYGDLRSNSERDGKIYILRGPMGPYTHFGGHGMSLVINKEYTMFEWFKRDKYTEQTTATDDMLCGIDLNGKDGNGYQPLPTTHSYPVMPPAYSLGKSQRDGYTVGVDMSGDTILNVSHNGTVITITMNSLATERLIKLLSVTLPSEEIA